MSLFILDKQINARLAIIDVSQHNINKEQTAVNEHVVFW